MLTDIKLNPQKSHEFLIKWFNVIVDSFSSHSPSHFSPFQHHLVF
jgi:hypothetical protein